MCLYQYEKLRFESDLLTTAQKKNFSIKDFFSKSSDLRTFTEEILNRKLHLLCSILIYLEILHSDSE